MTHRLRLAVVSLSALYLTACGSGGSDSGSGSTLPDSSSTIIKNAKDYTPSRLNSAATEIAIAQYQGKTTNAEVDLLLVQRAHNLIFSSDSKLSIPWVAVQDYGGDVKDDEIKKTYSCDQGGSVAYDGKVSNVVASIAMNYQNCWLSTNSAAITGSTALTNEVLSDTSWKIGRYFDNLRWNYESMPYTLSGVSSFYNDINQNNGDSELKTYQNVTYTIGSEQYRLAGDFTTSLSIGNVNHADLDFYIGSEGKLIIEMNGVSDIHPQIFEGELIFKGDKTTALVFEQGSIRYLEDADNDGKYDVGTFLRSYEDILYGDLTNITLVAVSDMSMPPTVYSPILNSGNTVDTTTPITVNPGYYYDDDTELEDLSISYRWYINDELVEDISGDTLPAYRATFGDVLEVAMVVSDSVNNIESDRTTITLSDAPAQVTFENLPDSVSPGDYVQFTVIISDPDLGNNQGAATLVSAPSGATMNADGLISWQVPTNQLFKTLHYSFTFANGENDTAATTTHISVTNNAVQELVRSGVEVPKQNNAMAIGDFDHDGDNEVLVTDSQNRVFLLSYKNDIYEQTWMYPYTFEQGGRVKQVLSTDINKDNYADIFVVSSHSISVLTDIDKVATTLIATDEYIHSAVLGDINNDGEDELAFISSTRESSDLKKIVVVALDTPETPLFTFDVEDTFEIALGNVDSDAQMELITNSGMVFDLDTGANQWFLGTGFGNRHIAVADLDSDGIDEIVGADSWGFIYVYSAQDKSQIASHENFNTCDISAGKLTFDSEPVLLIGDCQWGNVHAMKLSDNTLTNVFAVDMVDHSSSSLTLGDADNDGLNELLWGTGITSSGGDSLVTADVTATSATIKASAITYQLDSFSAAGWADLYPGEQRAVFFVPSTDSDYGGSKVLLMDENGSYITSEEVSSNWDNSRIAVTSDYNNDGAGDLFLPSAETYDGSFAAMRLSDFSIQYEIVGGYSNDISVIKSFDFNRDGFDDAVFVDNRTLKAVDVNNQVLLATYTLPQYFRDFDIVKMNDVVYVAISFGDNTTQLLKPTASGFSIQASTETTCARLTFINADRDSAPELACYINEGQSLALFDVADASLTKISDIPVSAAIVDMVPNPVTESDQTLLVTSANDDNWENYGTSRLIEMTVKGNEIWKSPTLIGQAHSHSLHARKTNEGSLEVMMGTTRAMYWLGR